MDSFKKIYNLLPKNFKKKSLIFIFLSIFASVLEMIGIGLIFPLLEIIINNNFSKSLFGINLNDYFINYNNNQIISKIVYIIIILYFFKTIFLILFNYWQLKFSQNIYKFLSMKLLKKYIHNPISFYHRKNSSVLLRNVIFETKNYGASINIVLKLFAEIFITLFILVLVIYLEPKVSLIVIITILSFVIFFYFLTSKKIYTLGSIKLKNLESASKVVGQTFSGIRDIKLKSVESYFYNLYKIFLDKLVRVQNYQQAIIDSPRIIFEFLIICLILIGLIFYLKFNNDINKLLPIIGMYLVVAFRLIPAVMRILNMIQSIKGLQPSMNMLNNELENYENFYKKKNLNENEIPFQNNIKFDKVNFSYLDSPKLFNDLSFEIKKFNITGIHGKSGSGKSTLIDLLTGLLVPSKGEIIIDDRVLLTKENISNWQKKIGYVSQDIFLFDTSIRKNIVFGQNEDEIDDNKINEVLKEAQIYDFINKLDKKLETLVGERGVKLSGGQIQRIGIARELYRNSDIIIFDESTSALDISTENLILDCIKNLKKNKTVILISHRENTLKICDAIIKLK